MRKNRCKICFSITFSDLCSSDHLPEVEIFSLLEEQIPKYRLRADTLTQFAGYQNEVSEQSLELYSIHMFYTKEIILNSSIYLQSFNIQDWFVPTPALRVPEGESYLLKSKGLNFDPQINIIHTHLDRSFILVQAKREGREVTVSSPSGEKISAYTR